MSSGVTARGRLAFHFRLQSKSDPVEPDGDVVLLHLEHLRELLDRQALDVTKQEQACVVAVQDGKGTSQPFLQQKGGLDGGARREIVVRRLCTKVPPARSLA